jgi:galactonate dehydratase
MKITDVKVHVVAPEGRALNTAGDLSRWVFVEVETDEGITGIGEATNSPRRGSQMVGRALQIMKESLIGKDPAHIEKIWIEMFRNYTYLGNRGLITTAISGVNIALWDIKGKALGKLIYDLLGGPVRDSIPLYTHPSYGSPEEVAESGRELVAQGYTAMKTDPFQDEMRQYHTAYVGGQISREGEKRGAKIIEKLRDAVGPDIEILIDAHGHYNVATAMRCIRLLQPYDITWFEEPVPPEGYDALKQIRSQTDVDLCVGERLFTRWDFIPIFQNGLANYIMPDVCWTGGISELKKISTMAEAYFVPVSPHGAMGPLQALAGAHVVMTVPNLYRLETFSLRVPLYNQFINPSLDIRNGVMYLSERPGLGAELDMDFTKSHRDPDWA